MVLLLPLEMLMAVDTFDEELVLLIVLSFDELARSIPWLLLEKTVLFSMMLRTAELSSMPGLVAPPLTVMVTFAMVTFVAVESSIPALPAVLISPFVMVQFWMRTCELLPEVIALPLVVVA